MSQSYRFVAEGRVQGVGFRVAVLREARRRALDGWVRNRDDGAVEGVASGDAAQLASFHAWLERGPPLAEVRALLWEATDEPEAREFSIRR